MGLLDLFKQRSKFSKEDLLPHLTACLRASMEAIDVVSETFKTTASIDSTLHTDDLSSVVYSVDPSLAYKDKDGTYGWIQLWNEYDDSSIYYLIRISPPESYKTLLSLKIDGTNYKDGYVHSFESVIIPEFEDGLSKTINALIAFGQFNNYTKPPPYCVFAKMLSE